MGNEKVEDRYLKMNRMKTMDRKRQTIKRNRRQVEMAQDISN
jgi:hypothetical protein